MTPAVWQAIERAVRSIRYGTVQITIHNAQVVQIDRLERVRIPTAATAGVEGEPEGQPHLTTRPSDRTSGGPRLTSSR